MYCNDKIFCIVLWDNIPGSSPGRLYLVKLAAACGARETVPADDSGVGCGPAIVRVGLIVGGEYGRVVTVDGVVAVSVPADTLEIVAGE